MQFLDALELGEYFAQESWISKWRLFVDQSRNAWTLREVLQAISDQ